MDIFGPTFNDTNIQDGAAQTNTNYGGYGIASSKVSPYWIEMSAGASTDVKASVMGRYILLQDTTVILKNATMTSFNQQIEVCKALCLLWTIDHACKDWSNLYKDSFVHYES